MNSRLNFRRPIHLSDPAERPYLGVHGTGSSSVDAFRIAFAQKLASMERELTDDRSIVATALSDVNREIAKLKKLLLTLADKGLDSDELLNALVEAERRRKALEEQRDAITADLPSIPANLAELYRAKVGNLSHTLSDPEIVHRASELIAEFIERADVRWSAEQDAHTIEIFGDLIGLLALSDPEGAPTYDAHRSSLKVVAGA